MRCTCCTDFIKFWLRPPFIYFRACLRCARFSFLSCRFDSLLFEILAYFLPSLTVANVFMPTSMPIGSPVTSCGCSSISIPTETYQCLPSLLIRGLLNLVLRGNCSEVFTQP